MAKNAKNLSKWPELVYKEWKDTLDTLHMWMQIPGKVKLALHPFINQWWEVAFYLNSQGMSTGLIPYKDGAFDVEFDFIHHEILIHKTNDDYEKISLYPRSVASFYSEFMDALKHLRINVTINPIPAEVQNPIPCDEDEIHSSYDSKYVSNWWQLLVNCKIVFEHFRSSFRGKSSPIHFFWGSFDLNGTRHSGKLVKPPDYGGRIMRYAENEENFSFGFWPGDSRFPDAAFYSYLYPATKGIETVHVKPKAATFNSSLGEFILPYEKIISSSSPENMILEFLQSTYKESAEIAGWDMKLLEGPVPF